MRKLLTLISIVLLAIFGQMNLALAQDGTNEKKQRILFHARLSNGTPILQDGVEWRIFDADKSKSGNIEELAFTVGGSKAFNIGPGDYLVHAAYGHAGAVRKITVLDQPAQEELILNAGGLRLSATTTDNLPVPARMLRFEVFEDTINQNGERRLIARDVRSDKVIALPVGTYHVVSRYGNLNASVRADLRVEPGKLTEASLQHRAAQISFRLVRSSGGDAVADTAWSILTQNGEVIEESNSPFPRMVLAEGNYSAIAKHNEAVYSQDFRVRAGFNADVEVIAPN
ncbi:MAG: hypothetical protein AAF217_14225 [Pseudomonadota bacterium]